MPIPEEDLDDEAPASQAPAESPVEPEGVAGDTVVGPARRPVVPDAGTKGAAPDRKKSRGEVLLEATGVIKGAAKSVFK